MKPYPSAIFLFLWMAIFLVLFGVARWIGHVQAQDKPTPPTPAATAPAMSADMGIKLRDATIAQAKLVIQLKDTITTYNQLQAALNAQAKTLEDLKTTALKEAKLDPEKWDVDLEKFAYVAKPEPAKPATPAPKLKP